MSEKISWSIVHEGVSDQAKAKAAKCNLFNVMEGGVSQFLTSADITVELAWWLLFLGFLSVSRSRLRESYDCTVYGTWSGRPS